MNLYPGFPYKSFIFTAILRLRNIVPHATHSELGLPVVTQPRLLIGELKESLAMIYNVEG